MFAPDDDIYSPKSSWFNDDSKEWDSDRLNFDIDLKHHGHDEVFTYTTGNSVDIGYIMRMISVTGAVIVAAIILAVLGCCFCRRRRNRGLVLAPPTATTTTTVTTTAPRGAATVVSMPVASVPYPTQQYYAPSPAPVVQPYPVTYPAQSYPMPTPYPPHAPMEHPSAPGYNAPPPTYEQATDATAKQPPYNPYAPS